MLDARNGEIGKLNSDVNFYVKTCDELKGEKAELR